MKQEHKMTITNGTDEIAVGLSVKENNGTYIHVISADAESEMKILFSSKYKDYDDLICSVFIPESAVDVHEDNILQNIVYREPKLFPSSSSTVASPVFSISIGSKNIDKITPLNENITLVFKKNTKRAVSCAYWNFSKRNGESNGHWDTKGLTEISNTGEYITCKSNHLTNFALIVDEIHVLPDTLIYLIMSYLSLACAVMSWFGSIITIVVYSVVKELCDRIPSKIVVRLSLSLLVLTTVYQGLSERRTKGATLCLVISSSIHYFLLVSFMWMLIEAVSMLFMFVRPLHWKKMNKHKFLRRATCFSLLVPSAIVATTVVFGLRYRPEDLYSSKHCIVKVRCWMFRFGVEFPIVVVLFFNAFVLIYSAMAIHRQSNVPGQCSGQLNSWKKWKITFGMSVMLGVTWIFGAIPNAGVTEQILFDVLCGLQGFFIFFLFVLLQEDTRKIICCSNVTLLVGIPSISVRKRRTKTV